VLQKRNIYFNKESEVSNSRRSCEEKHVDDVQIVQEVNIKTMMAEIGKVILSGRLITMVFWLQLSS